MGLTGKTCLSNHKVEKGRSETTVRRLWVRLWRSVKTWQAFDLFLISRTDFFPNLKHLKLKWNAASLADHRGRGGADSCIRSENQLRNIQESSMQIKILANLHCSSSGNFNYSSSHYSCPLLAVIYWTADIVCLAVLLLHNSRWKSLFWLSGSFACSLKQPPPHPPTHHPSSAAAALCNYIQPVPLASTLDITADIQQHSSSSPLLSLLPLPPPLSLLTGELSLSQVSVQSCLVFSCVCAVQPSRWKQRGGGNGCRDEGKGRRRHGQMKMEPIREEKERMSDFHSRIFTAGGNWLSLMGKLATSDLMMFFFCMWVQTKSKSLCIFANLYLNIKDIHCFTPQDWILFSTETSGRSLVVIRRTFKLFANNKKPLNPFGRKERSHKSTRGLSAAPKLNQALWDLIKSPVTRCGKWALPFRTW